MVAEGLDQVAFADARRPQPEHVAGLADEAAGGQVVNLLLLEGGVERPVEAVEGLEFAEAGGLDAALEEPVGTHGQLVLQDQLQELGVVEAVAGGLLQAHLQAVEESRQPQLLEGLA